MIHCDNRIQKAESEYAELLINIYNAAFYSDYRRYGVCPGYGKTTERMEASIKDHPKYIILIVPAYQGKGIGTKAVQFVKALYADWKTITPATPADKIENVKSYTEKCGFRIVSVETDGHVELARFITERNSD